MLRSLRHRNIVQFYGACLEPDCFFIVTELMHGARTCCQAVLQKRMSERLAKCAICKCRLTHIPVPLHQ